MAADDSEPVLGEDIADVQGGSIVKVTQGWSARFGTARVRSTPISEQVIIGAAIVGMRNLAEIMLIRFTTLANSYSLDVRETEASSHVFTRLPRFVSLSKIEGARVLQILDGSSRFPMRDNVKHVLGVRMSRLESSIMVERDHSLLCAFR
jgi:hypothetical protein